jgi:amidase
MARTVKDAATILQAIAGPDPNDNYTSAIPNNGTLPNYVAACNYSAFEGARIGVPWNVIELLSDNTTVPITTAFSAAITLIQNAGATIVPANFTAAAAFLNSSTETEVLNADFIVDLAKYLSELTYNPNNVHTLADIRNFTHAFPAEDWPARDTAIWDDALFQQGWNNTDPRFWSAYQTDVQLYGGSGGLLGTLQQYSLDAVILPTSFASSWAAIVGAPIVTVPMGYFPSNASVVLSEPTVYGLVDTGPHVPFGLSFLGKRFSEGTLIGFGYAFEQRTMVRNMVRPYIVPNVELGDVVGY